LLANKIPATLDIFQELQEFFVFLFIVRAKYYFTKIRMNLA